MISVMKPIPAEAATPMPFLWNSGRAVNGTVLACVMVEETRNQHNHTEPNQDWPQWDRKGGRPGRARQRQLKQHQEIDVVVVIHHGSGRGPKEVQRH